MVNNSNVISVVCTIIDNHRFHHFGQNVVDSRGAVVQLDHNLMFSIMAIACVILSCYWEVLATGLFLCPVFSAQIVIEFVLGAHKVLYHAAVRLRAKRFTEVSQILLLSLCHTLFLASQ